MKIKAGDFVYSLIPYPLDQSSPLCHLGRVCSALNSHCIVTFANEGNGARGYESLMILSPAEYEEKLMLAKALEAVR